MVWASDDPVTEVKETGDCTTLALEICVEMLTSSVLEELLRKYGLFFQSGTEEVWVVDSDHCVRFLGEEEMEGSEADVWH